MSEYDLGEVYEKYRETVARVITSMTGNADQAEDLTQETFVRVIRSFHTYRYKSEKSKDPLLSWLLRIAINVVRDEGRHQKVASRREFTSDLAVSMVYIDDPNLNKLEIQQAVDDITSNLSSRQRRVFLEKHQNGARIAEIMAKEGLSRDSVRGDLYRSAHKLKDKITPP